MTLCLIMYLVVHCAPETPSWTHFLSHPLKCPTIGAYVNLTWSQMPIRVLPQSWLKNASNLGLGLVILLCQLLGVSKLVIVDPGEQRPEMIDMMMLVDAVENRNQGILVQPGESSWLHEVTAGHAFREF